VLAPSVHCGTLIEKPAADLSKDIPEHSEQFTCKYMQAFRNIGVFLSRQHWSWVWRSAMLGPLKPGSAQLLKSTYEIENRIRAIGGSPASVDA
jgi:hypothetical protein